MNKTIKTLLLIGLILSITLAACNCGKTEPLDESASTQPVEQGDDGTPHNTADVKAPTCSDIIVTDIAATSVKVSWRTDEPATSLVEYGRTTDYGLRSDFQGDAVIDHSVVLEGLDSGTLYHFRVRSNDAAWNEGVSGDLTFTTQDIKPPIFDRIDITSITQRDAVLIWKTKEPTTGQVDYGTASSYDSTSPSSAALGTDHTATLSNLTPETTYHFRIKATDASGNEKLSEDHTFITWLDQSKLQGRILYCEAPSQSNNYLIDYTVYFLDVGTNQKTKVLDFKLPWYLQEMDAAVVLSPDRTKIAYFTSVTSALQVTTGSLHVLSLDTRQDVPLISYQLKSERELGVTREEAGLRTLEKIYISWSPDGSKIAYVIDHNLHVIGADGSSDILLHRTQPAFYIGLGWVRDQVRRPLWASDGAHIIFDEFMSLELMLDRQTDLHYRAIRCVDLTGQETWNFFYGIAKRLPPTSNRLVVAHYISYPEMWVSTINDDGTSRQRLTALQANNYDFSLGVWSADGTMVVAPNDQGVLEILDAVTGAERYSDSRRIYPAMTEGSILWNPSGDFIAYKGNPKPYYYDDVTWTANRVSKRINIVSRDLTQYLALDIGANNTDAWLLAWLA